VYRMSWREGDLSGPAAAGPRWYPSACRCVTISPRSSRGWKVIAVDHPLISGGGRLCYTVGTLPVYRMSWREGDLSGPAVAGPRWYPSACRYVTISSPLLAGVESDRGRPPADTG
jgi:TRAP-type mannitol/chloroaromatic compound transport system permease small subunit